MKYFTALFAIFLGLIFESTGQVQPDQIEIVRDSFGVPHIFGPTDAAVAYGLAWATSEDDFRTVQRQLLAVRGSLARLEGIQGAAIDIAVQWMQMDPIVDQRYESDLSPEFKKILQAYCDGVNAYAREHPEEVLVKGFFPAKPKDLIKGYILGLAVLTGVDRDFGRLQSGNLENETSESIQSRGSNAMAISRNKTTDGKTYLAINSHQPLEGLYSWYEVHLHSEEGMNIHGATFPGGVSIFLGANESLAWAHTVNHPDFNDIYRLTMHPEKKLTYRLDGEWKQLEKAKATTKVKFGPLKIPISKKYYRSEHGLCLKNDQGFYAIRFSANRDIRAAEQWYRMSKAQNLEAFMEALNMQGITSTNIVYADREDHIFYISNGRLPVRNPAFDWAAVLPGDTSACIWSDAYYPIDSLPQVLDPPSGFVFNTNNSPFSATGSVDNVPAESINATTGYQLTENNRSLRFLELIGHYDKLSYEEFKKIKYDLHYHDSLYLFGVENLSWFQQLEKADYPQYAPLIETLNQWDRSTDTTSTGATVFLLCINHLYPKIREARSKDQSYELIEEDIAAALAYTQKHLDKYFDGQIVSWGQVQRHRRGNVDLAVGGGPDILAAMYSVEAKDGRFKSQAGESFIQLVRFSQQGIEIETVNAYGASANAESPHYTDQMQNYVQQKTKTMSLDKEIIYSTAKSIYKPK